MLSGELKHRGVIYTAPLGPLLRLKTNVVSCSSPRPCNYSSISHLVPAQKAKALVYTRAFCKQAARMAIISTLPSAGSLGRDEKPIWGAVLLLHRSLHLLGPPRREQLTCRSASTSTCSVLVLRRVILWGDRPRLADSGRGLAPSLGSWRGLRRGRSQLW